MPKQADLTTLAELAGWLKERAETWEAEGELATAQRLLHWADALNRVLGEHLAAPSDLSDPDWTLGDCECCEAQDVLVTECAHLSKQRGKTETSRFCRLCFNTFASNVVTLYPDQYEASDAHALHAICHVGNAILKAIESRARD